jgi:anti-anti-sigma factor
VRTAQSTLAVDVHSADDRVEVTVEGELDVTSSPLLQAVVDQALAARRTPPCSHLVLDLAGVTFADASGMSPILLARALLARRGGRLELRNCQRPVGRVLAVLGLSDLHPAG